jgi:hypothetical protein
MISSSYLLSMRSIVTSPGGRIARPVTLAVGTGVSVLDGGAMVSAHGLAMRITKPSALCQWEAVHLPWRSYSRFASAKRATLSSQMVW